MSTRTPRRRTSDRIPTSTQVIGGLVALLLAGLGFYNQHLTTEIDRLIDTQRLELQRISVLETEARYNKDAITSLDERLHVEVEIPAGMRR